ncbi:MAG: hypothetical protein IPO32_19435 [Crocinitomicaceae bacterium]|nr:hypothetical protein [Crocinitomicaceae bacterium]
MPAGYPDVVYDADLNPTSWFNPPSMLKMYPALQIYMVLMLFLLQIKQKWTRCPVIETSHVKSQAIGNSSMMKLRESNSVDQNGNAEPGTGMGWFPGYAIDVETGTRLNMAFGENSWLAGSNGSDMIWNPSR